MAAICLSTAATHLTSSGPIVKKWSHNFAYDADEKNRGYGDFS